MSYIFSHIFIPLAILFIFSEKLKLDKKYIVLFSFVGILPDLDVIFLHRMSFHNIFIIFPILFIMLAMKKDSIAGIVCFYLISHLILDMFNGGISALYPFYDGIFFINAEIRSSYNIDGMMYTLNYGIKNSFVNNISRAGNGYGIISSENFGIIVLLMIIILVSFIKDKIER